MDRPLIRVSNLVHAYEGRRVLDVEGLSINRGDIVALLGRNGSGKSTLLRMMSLLEKPSSGDILFHGKLLELERDRFAQRRRMAMVFQEPLLFSGTVTYNVSYGLAIRGLPRDDIAEKRRRALSLLAIEHLASRRVETLSGGEAQRVSLARALAGEPEILFLDEPMANLDNPTRMSFRRDLGRVLAQLEATVVYVTHEVGEALYLGNRIAVMSGGKIVQDAAPAEVWNRPATSDVASIVGAEGLVPGVVLEPAGEFTRVRCGGKDILSLSAALPGAGVLVCIRPEHVVIGDPSPDEGAPGHDRMGAGNLLQGVVRGVEPLGAVTGVTVDCGFPITAHLVGQPGQSVDLRPGANVSVRFHPDRVHLIRSGNGDLPA